MNHRESSAWPKIPRENTDVRENHESVSFFAAPVQRFRRRFCENQKDAKTLSVLHSKHTANYTGYVAST